ncbi:hypothetical protein SAY87_002727 [Trapa incisa]|uniref:Uncharacterized protein n=1 Tax=Trapa incisa TaxID=236973 RepID=A0AAN7PVY5_9MYRT|nr:hypothetical protein SAY87_002727 [Trapa incisa]
MGRSPCCEKAHTNKGAWTKEEDDRLITYIRAHGEGCWRSLPKAAGLLRCGKSCRLRWINYLRPDLKRGNFTVEEDELIIKLHSLLGNKWSLIAGRLPGRTDNEIKNYWNTHIRRKLLSRGIDPATHQPINELHKPPATAAPLSDLRDQMDALVSFRIKKEEAGTEHQQCPDLNLELRISPPHYGQFPLQADQQMKSGGRSDSHCFACSLGVQDSKECSCRIEGCGDGGGSTVSSYDFLGLKAGVRDFRGLEMK